VQGLRILEVKAKQRWKVVFKDKPHWQLGIYVPENEDFGNIRFLEKHNCPEMFYLVRGKIVLVLSNGERLEEIEMKEGIIYIVECWHNAYRPRGAPGVALVVERSDVETEYRPLSEFKP